MSAEPKQSTTPEVWTQWDGKVVNGAYPLNRFLGGTNHSGVFLTEHFAEKRPNVAIKLIPADTVQAEAQLMQWAATTTLAHDSLVRIFDVGRHRFDGREFLFVVTEFADQTLAEILPRRPLAIEEVRELILPTLDALIFLHRRGLIHGRLRPTNFLAVDDRLKLSSDSIRPIVHTASGSQRASAYDPPELKDRGMDAAGDVWGLGMTLLEALTQRTTAWPDDTVSLPADLPEPFTSILLKCLSAAPGSRPTVLDLEAQFKPSTLPSLRRPTTPPPPKTTVVQPPRKPIAWRRAVTATLPIVLIGWAFYHVFENRPEPTPPPAAPTPAPPVAAPIVEKTVEPELPTPTPPPPAASIAPTDVIQEVTPDVPQATLDRIRGRIHVSIRVLVDSDGNVVGTMMDNPGPNANLARLADEAASEWKFIAAPRADTRVWSLLFVFSRDGINTRATAQ